VRKLKNHLFQGLLENVPKPGEAKGEPLIGDKAKESPVPVTAGERPQAQRGQRRAQIGEEAKESPVPVTAEGCPQARRDQKRAQFGEEAK
jgi:hypothetical protein